MDKKAKLIQALKLRQAIKDGQGEFVLLEKLDQLEDKIDNIKPEVKDEEIEISLDIV